MKKKKHTAAKVGGTTVAPSLDDSKLDRPDGDHDARHSGSDHDPSLRHEPVVAGAGDQLDQRDRLRGTRSRNPIVLVTATLLTLSLAFALYLTFAAYRG